MQIFSQMRYLFGLKGILHTKRNYFWYQKEILKLITIPKH